MVDQTIQSVPFNWRTRIDKKVYNTDYTITENDRIVVCKTDTSEVNITLFDSVDFEHPDEFNRYAVFNNGGSNMVNVDIANAGVFLQGTDMVGIKPEAGMTFSVMNIYDEIAETNMNVWAISKDTVLTSEIDEQSTVDIDGQTIFLVQLAQPIVNNANITVNETDEKIIINDEANYNIKSVIRLVDDLPSGDTLNVWVKIYNSSDVSIRQEVKQYSLAGDETESAFDFDQPLAVDDYIQFEVETLTNFNGKYQIKSIEIAKKISGFG